VTYQITARAMDGMVIASDQAERHVSDDLRYGVTNLVEKIRIDPSGQFAWAYSGGLVAPMFSAELFKNMSALHATGNPITRTDVENAITRLLCASMGNVATAGERAYSMRAGRRVRQNKGNSTLEFE
jgi:hypothetical protein